MIYHAMRRYGREEVELHIFLTSVLDGSEWSALSSEKKPLVLTG
jgi:hypothetical protein